MPRERTARFRARRDECAQVLAFVETAVRELDARLVPRVTLAVEELFLNTVMHGHGGDSDAPVEITVRGEDGRVALVYVDAAPPFDPFAAVQPPDAETAVERRPDGRLGVFLVTALAARYDYVRAGGHNRVIVEFSAPGQ
jgi:anti-sigma regulatory factor (Ser/Thr protein kinase)